MKTLTFKQYEEVISGGGAVFPMPIKLHRCVSLLTAVSVSCNHSEQTATVRRSELFIWLGAVLTVHVGVDSGPYSVGDRCSRYTRRAVRLGIRQTNHIFKRLSPPTVAL